MRVFSLRGGTWSMKDNATAQEARALVVDDEITWIRAGGKGLDTLDRLAKEFHLHPLSMEDIRNNRQRPKVEDYEDHTFVVLRVPVYRNDEVEWRQAGIFIGSDFVITAGQEYLQELASVERHVLQKGLPKDRNTACYLAYLIIDAIVDAWFPFMDALEETIEELEDIVIDRADKKELARIRDMKHIISRTRKVSAPMREALLFLERSEHPNVSPATQVYLRDVSDHMVRLAERLEHVKEVALIAQETWNSTLANTQNEQMRRLTIVAALLLFPGLVAGLGGMNFEAGFPSWGYWQVTGGIIAFILLGFGISKWRGWI